MKARTKLLLTLLPIAGLTAMVVTRPRGSASEAQVQSAIVGSESIHVVHVQTVETGPWISGALKAEREAAVRAELGGRIVALYAQEGDRVKSSALLARIEDPTAESGVLAAKAAIRNAEENETTALRNADRAAALLKIGGLPQRDVEAARTAYVNAQAQLADARSALAIANRQVEKTSVRAPFSGFVSVRSASVGDVVQPGLPLFTIVDPESMRLQAAVPASRLGELRRGGEVRFRVVGYGERQFTGVIDRISPVADAATRQVSIYVRIPNQSRSLVAGLYAEGRVASQARQSTVVPLSAIDETGLMPQVTKVEGGKVKRVAVTLGVRDTHARIVEIRSGLAAGDTVLTGTVRALPAGMPVTLQP